MQRSNFHVMKDYDWGFHGCDVVQIGTHRPLHSVKFSWI